MTIWHKVQPKKWDCFRLNVDNLTLISTNTQLTIWPNISANSVLITFRSFDRSFCPGFGRGSEGNQADNREIDMTTYNATAATAFEPVTEQQFSSLNAAKAWARENVTSKISVVISDSRFPSRHIKVAKLYGKNFWSGSAPESWFRA